MPSARRWPRWLQTFLTARKLDEANQRTVTLTPAELKTVKEKSGAAIGKARTGMVRNSLRHVLDIIMQALDRWEKARRVYQFEVTLRDAEPPIWRRIQVTSCTLDKLHEHVQTAMGWTNSHLHDFKIDGKGYGDPLLLGENFEEFDYADSTTTELSDVLPEGGQPSRFEYQYDFGDSWWHEVLFEGVTEAEAGRTYPVCVEGARACPPEDVGGVWGYADFVRATQDESDERHDELLEWVGGSFDPEAFDPAEATRRMRRGLPDWRRML